MLLELLSKAMFAFLSGISEFIFVSTGAHQLLYQTVTGRDYGDCLLSFGVHLGCMAALLLNCHKRITHLRNEKRSGRSVKRRRGRQADVGALMDIRILNTAAVPIVLGIFIGHRLAQWMNSPLWIVLALVFNGGVLFLPQLFSSGNKNGRSFSRLDSLLLGTGGALGALPGFSRIGCIYSIGVARGAGKSYALELSILLSIPAVAAMMCLDVYGCLAASSGIAGVQLLGFLISSLASFAGAHMSIALIRFLCSRSTFSGFAYYSFGLAMFLFLLYLFVV